MSTDSTGQALRLRKRAYRHGIRITKRRKVFHLRSGEELLCSGSDADIDHRDHHCPSAGAWRSRTNAAASRPASIRKRSVRTVRTRRDALSHMTRSVDRPLEMLSGDDLCQRYRSPIRRGTMPLDLPVNKLLVGVVVICEFRMTGSTPEGNEMFQVEDEE